MDEIATNGLSTIFQETAPLRARIIEAMRTAIERGHLRPGDRLVEKTLCEQLGVSRTSLREALRELEAIGVLAPSPGRGLSVVTISSQDAENIYAIRADIEARAVAQFCVAADEADMQVFDRLCGELVGTYRSGAVVAIIEAKKTLFRHVCDVAQNAIALELVSRLTLRTAQLRSRSLGRKGRQAESIVEIEELRRAVLARDVAAAKEAARRHVENAGRSALKGA